MLGRGDWKAYKGKSDDELAAIYEQKADELFEVSRMEHRLATFEHLTLASMQAQSDQNFSFLVVSSDRMPIEYRRRLEKCARDGSRSCCASSRRCIYLKLLDSMLPRLKSTWLTSCNSA